MNSPIRNIEGIKTLIQIGVAWVVIMGFWELTLEQQALTISFFIALVNVAGGYFEMKQTTPLAEPVDEDGTLLVREGTGQPTRAMARKMSE